MIARIWRGVTSAERADEYLAYLEATGLRDDRATAGNRGVQVLRRIRDGCAEFLLITHWDSLDAVRAFAGDEVDRAVSYPEDEAFLLELEPTVAHDEVVGKG